MCQCIRNLIGCNIYTINIKAKINMKSVTWVSVYSITYDNESHCQITAYYLNDDTDLFGLIDTHFSNMCCPKQYNLLYQIHFYGQCRMVYKRQTVPHLNSPIILILYSIDLKRKRRLLTLVWFISFPSMNLRQAQLY